MYAFKLKFARVLNIYKNHPVGNFRHKHEHFKCDGPYSLKLPTRNGAIHLISFSTWNFRFSRVNGEYPRSPFCLAIIGDLGSSRPEKKGGEIRENPC